MFTQASDKSAIKDKACENPKNENKKKTIQSRSVHAL